LGCFASADLTGLQVLHFTFESAEAYMEAQLRTMAGWVNQPDQ